MCRKCLWPQFTPDRITCEDCPARHSPTPLGDACQCADGYYSVSMEQLVCLDDEYDEEIITAANEIATLPGSAFHAAHELCLRVSSSYVDAATDERADALLARKARALLRVVRRRR